MSQFGRQENNISIHIQGYILCKILWSGGDGRWEKIKILGKKHEKG